MIWRVSLAMQLQLYVAMQVSEQNLQQQQQAHLRTSHVQQAMPAIVCTLRAFSLANFCSK